MSTDTADLATTEQAEQAAHDDGQVHDDHAHGLSDRGYVKIFLFLVVVTGAEVALSYMIEQLGPFFLPLLLLLMAVKFFTVVSYFMHLKFDSKLFTMAFYGGILIALAVYVGTALAFQPF